MECDTFSLSKVVTRLLLGEEKTRKVSPLGKSRWSSTSMKIHIFQSHFHSHFISPGEHVGAFRAPCYHCHLEPSSRLRAKDSRFQFSVSWLEERSTEISQIHYMQHADDVTITDSFIVKLSMFFGSEIFSHLRLTVLWHMHNSTPTRPSVYSRNVHEFPSETIRQVSTRWALKI